MTAKRSGWYQETALSQCYEIAVGRRFIPRRLINWFWRTTTRFRLVEYGYEKTASTSKSIRPATYAANVQQSVHFNFRWTVRSALPVPDHVQFVQKGLSGSLSHSNVTRLNTIAFLFPWVRVIDVLPTLGIQSNEVPVQSWSPRFRWRIG